MTSYVDERQSELTNIAAALDAERDPLARLRLLRSLELATRSAIRSSVESARTGHISWSQIGDALGISKQAAAQRHQRAETQTLRDDAEATSRPAIQTQPATKVKPAKRWRVLTPGGRTVLRIERDEGRS